MDSNQTIISMNNISKTFDSDSRKVTAIGNIDFEIKEGEFICIVGPSGCGKSTLLKMVAGFLEPTTGEILMDNQPINRPGADRAVVFQEDAVFPWMTVRQNLEYGPKIKKLPRKKQRSIVDHYLELVGLTDCQKLYPKQLSGGMKKRVDIARAYANDPRILLMDEPFGSLDVITKSRMQNELLKILRAEEKTVILITHDLEEAIYLGDRVVVLTERPAKIKKIIDIPFARPRQQSIKTTQKFQKLRKQSSKDLGIFREVEGNVQ